VFGGRAVRDWLCPCLAVLPQSARGGQSDSASQAKLGPHTLPAAIARSYYLTSILIHRNSVDRMQY